jgi:hypothetical protein
VVADPPQYSGERHGSDKHPERRLQVATRHLLGEKPSIHMDGAGGGALWRLLLDALVFPLLKFFFLHISSQVSIGSFTAERGEKQNKQIKT